MSSIRLSRIVGPAAIAAALTLSGVPLHPSVARADTSVSSAEASAFLLLAKKKKQKKTSGGAGTPAPGLTPAQADVKRQAIYESVQADRDAGRLEAAADGLEENAELLGDPIAMKEAGAVRLQHAKKERSVDAAQASIATTKKALDILHFYDAVASGSAESTWLAIEPSSASELIGQAEEQIAEAEALVEELESEDDAEDGGAVEGEDGKKKKKRERGKAKPGTGLIVGGSFLLALGASGIGLAVAGLVISNKRQKEVEDVPDPAGMGAAEVQRLDDEGKRANTLAYVGLGLAVVGLAVGIPLVVVGAKKRKQAGAGSQAHLQVMPAVGRDVAGALVRGRF